MRMYKSTQFAVNNESVCAYSLILVAMELDGTDARAPLAKLVDPVVQSGLGHNDHVGAMDAAVLLKIPQQ